MVYTMFFPKLFGDCLVNQTKSMDKYGKSYPLEERIKQLFPLKISRKNSKLFAKSLLIAVPRRAEFTYKILRGAFEQQIEEVL